MKSQLLDWSKLVSLALLLLATLIAGCSLFSRKAGVDSAGLDRTIESRVKTLLSQEPVLHSSQMSVKSSNGIVELAGFVDSTAAKDRAGLVAASAPGVAQVHNDLLVRAVSHP